MKTTVQLAYHTEAGQTQRVLRDSGGRIYIPGEGWTSPRGPVRTEGYQHFERWVDVPFSWVGAAPYWH